jgi:hypothetical protein
MHSYVLAITQSIEYMTPTSNTTHGVIMTVSNNSVESESNPQKQDVLLPKDLKEERSRYFRQILLQLDYISNQPTIQLQNNVTSMLRSAGQNLLSYHQLTEQRLEELEKVNGKQNNK